MRHLITHDIKYYGNIKDFFFVTEFQNRGSEHDHGLVWIKYEPINGKNTYVELEMFVDKYLSCDLTTIGDELKMLQHHRHTKRCRKRKKRAL
jgi:hypothetical protein